MSTEQVHSVEMRECAIGFVEPVKPNKDVNCRVQEIKRLEMSREKSDRIRAVSEKEKIVRHSEDLQLFEGGQGGDGLQADQEPWIEAIVGIQ
jgi:hypothetical protein